MSVLTVLSVWDEKLTIMTKLTEQKITWDSWDSWDSWKVHELSELSGSVSRVSESQSKFLHENCENSEKSHFSQSKFLDEQN